MKTSNKLKIRKIGLRIILPSIIMIVLFKVLTYVPSERTFIDVTHVSMTNGTVHLLMKSKRVDYFWGTGRTVEHRGFLLDYSPLTKNKKLYEITNSDVSNRTRYAITDKNIIFNETNWIDSSTESRQFLCKFNSIDLYQLPYKKSRQSSCYDSNQKNKIDSLSYDVKDTNLRRWNSEDLNKKWLADLLLYNRIDESLRFKRPGFYGDYFQIIDNGDAVIVEQQSITSLKHDEVIQVGIPFEFGRSNTLNEMSFERESRVLGFLENGQLLIAFDFTWAAKKSIVLVKWDLNSNTTQLIDRIYYTDLFSPSTFTLVHSPWWKKIQGFPFKKRHPIVEVFPID